MTICLALIILGLLWFAIQAVKLNAGWYAIWALLMAHLLIIAVLTGTHYHPPAFSLIGLTQKGAR